jgi:hypothetical protein
MTERDPYETGSRIEAAAAGVRHEQAEAEAGVAPREHVTADLAAADVDAVPARPDVVAVHRHHPDDPNLGVVRMRVSRGALVASVVAAAVTTLGVVLLAIAVGSR